jgi:hypothetical protein
MQAGDDRPYLSFPTSRGGVCRPSNARSGFGRAGDTKQAIKPIGRARISPQKEAAIRDALARDKGVFEGGPRAGYRQQHPCNGSRQR